MFARKVCFLSLGFVVFETLYFDIVFRLVSLLTRVSTFRISCYTRYENFVFTWFLLYKYNTFLFYFCIANEDDALERMHTFLMGAKDVNVQVKALALTLTIIIILSPNPNVNHCT